MQPLAHSSKPSDWVMANIKISNAIEVNQLQSVQQALALIRSEIDGWLKGVNMQKDIKNPHWDAMKRWILFAAILNTLPTTVDDGDESVYESRPVIEWKNDVKRYNCTCNWSQIGNDEWNDNAIIINKL